MSARLPTAPPPLHLEHHPRTGKLWPCIPHAPLLRGPLFLRNGSSFIVQLGPRNWERARFAGRCSTPTEAAFLLFDEGKPRYVSVPQDTMLCWAVPQG